MKIKKYLIILLSILTFNVNSEENISDIISLVIPVIPLSIDENYYLEFEYQNKNSEIYSFSHFKEEKNIKKPKFIKIYNNKELIQKIEIEYNIKLKKCKLIPSLKIDQFKLINY